MAETEGLEDQFEKYRRTRRDEVFRGFGDAAAGLTGDAAIMSQRRASQAKTSGADKAALRNDIYEQLASLESGRTLDQDMVKTMLEQATDLRQTGMITREALAAVKYSAEIGDAINQANERKQAALAGVSADPRPFLRSEVAGSKAFNKTLTETIAAHKNGSGWTGKIKAALDGGTLPAGHLPAFILALEGKMQWTAEERRTAMEEDGGHGGTSILAALNREALNVDKVQNDVRAIDTEIKKLTAKGNAYTAGLDGQSAEFSSAVLGGDEAQFAKLVEMYGGGVKRKKSPEESQIEAGLLETLELLESGDPTSRDIKDMIFEDERFKSWMNGQRYTDPEEAFKIWLKEAKVKVRRSAQDTKRMSRINASIGATPGAVKGAIGQVMSTPSQRQEAVDRQGEGYQARPGTAGDSYLEVRRQERYKKRIDTDAEDADEEVSADTGGEGGDVEWGEDLDEGVIKTPPEKKMPAPGSGGFPTSEPEPEQGASLGSSGDYRKLRRTLRNGQILASAQA